MQAMGQDEAWLAGKLEAVVRRAFPGATIASLRRLTGGASLQTWRFDAIVDGAFHRLILRCRPEGVAPLMNAVSLATEAAVIAAAGANGVPVASIRIVLEAADGLGEGFIADFVDGETVPRRILRDAAFATLRDTMVASCGAILARVHALTVDEPLARLTAVEQLDSMEESYRSRTMRNPVFDYAFRWLRERMPAPPAALSLVHGDFRMGNLLVGPDSIRAVLDWELVHLGDPAEDFGWLTVNSWRFGNIDRPVAGLGQVEEILDAYADETGIAMSLERVLYWRALGSLRWGIGAGEMADAFSHGADRSVERGMIGRRISETEVDLLDIVAPRRVA